MQLPSDSIGISDILAYRDCPQRFAFGMRRHVDLPERFALFPGEKDEPPEHTNWTNAYGSAIHHAIAKVDKDGLSDDEAVQSAWTEYGPWLDPDDLDNLYEDIALYHERTTLGYRLIAAEVDMKVPLFVYQGRQIYFRFKVDALYQHMQNAGLWLSRDYKSSKWPKSEEDIKKDLQQWSYNWGLHEYFPEIETLVQEYDQLRAGVVPIRKADSQRKQIKRWLIKQVTAMLEDDALKPRQNQWCPYCPILMDCRVTHLSADYWKNRIEAIAPSRKEGRKVVIELTEDAEGFAYYAELLPRVSLAQKTLKRFEEEVKAVVKQMPQERREELGFELRERKGRAFPASVLRAVHRQIGDEFYQVIGLTKSKLESFYGKGKAGDDTPRDEILDMGEPKVDATMVIQKGDE